MKLATAIIMSLFMSLTAFAQSNQDIQTEAADLVRVTLSNKKTYLELVDFQRNGNTATVTIGFFEDGVSCKKQVFFSVDTEGKQSAQVSDKSCSI